MRNESIPKAEEFRCLQAASASFNSALLAGHQQRARAVADRLLAAGVAPRSLYKALILPLQALLADGVNAGNGTADSTQRAVELAMNEAEWLGRQVPAPNRPGVRAVVTACSGVQGVFDMHVLGDLFEFDGWHVEYLQPPLAVDAVGKLQAECSAQLVAICALRAQEPVEVVERISEEIAGRVRPSQVLVVSSDGRRRKASSNLSWVVGDEEAVLAARRLSGVRDPSLQQLLTVVGTRVQRTRKDRGLSQFEVARAAGLDRAYLSSIEHGKQNVTLGALLRIAGALGTGLDTLLKEL